MRDIYLLEVTQHKTKRYIGSVDAKSLVRLATTVELKTVQDAQRPVNPKRLEEIADFVAADGTLSTSIVIGTKDDRLSVEKANIKGIPNLFKMKFPETEVEFSEFENAFDIMDGQHRLFSFLEGKRKISDSEMFDITFEMYIKPTKRERRIIFKNTNEKQEKVAANLLMWFRAKLGMLDKKEQTYHPVVSLLNSEAKSPLKGRIIMGAERVVGGFKANQVITLLDKSDIKTFTGTPLSDEKMLTLISEYLLGWEQAVGSSISAREKELGAFSKISGLRFMILMLPEFYQQAQKSHQTFNKEFVANTLNELFAENGMLPRDLFEKDSDYQKNLDGNPFGGETPTTMLAKDWTNRLKVLKTDEFDPLAKV